MMECGLQFIFLINFHFVGGLIVMHRVFHQLDSGVDIEGNLIAKESCKLGDDCTLMCAT